MRAAHEHKDWRRCPYRVKLFCVSFKLQTLGQAAVKALLPAPVGVAAGKSGWGVGQEVGGHGGSTDEGRRRRGWGFAASLHPSTTNQPSLALPLRRPSHL